MTWSQILKVCMTEPVTGLTDISTDTTISDYFSCDEEFLHSPPSDNLNVIEQQEQPM